MTYLRAMAEVTLDGEAIHSEADIHRELERKLEFGDHYGRSVAALRDRLLTDVPRPIRIIWLNAGVSRVRLGDALFARIVEVFEEVERQDREFAWADRFEYELR